jgi:hypothetical protein
MVRAVFMLGGPDNAATDCLLTCLVKLVYCVLKSAICAARNILDDRPCWQSAGVATAKDHSGFVWPAGKLAHQLVYKILLADRQMNKAVTRIAARWQKSAVCANDLAAESAPRELGGCAELQLDVRGHEIQGGNPLAVVCVVFHNAATVVRCVLSCQINNHAGANFFSGPTSGPWLRRCQAPRRSAHAPT